MSPTISGTQPSTLHSRSVTSTGRYWIGDKYSSFKIGDEVSKYRLDVAGYSGDAGDALQYEGDLNGNGKFGLYFHSGMKFSNHDQDNDNSNINCAEARSGGWWYNSCMSACLTCKTYYYEWRRPAKVGARELVVASRMLMKPQ